MRLFPRIKQDLPVILNGKFTGSTATLSNLSLGGAFLRSQMPGAKVGDTLSLKYYLQGYGYLEHRGRATRKNHEGVAVAFYDLDSPTKVKLWGYIEERLRDLDECPYCGHPSSQAPFRVHSMRLEPGISFPGLSGVPPEDLPSRKSPLQSKTIILRSAPPGGRPTGPGCFPAVYQ